MQKVLVTGVTRGIGKAIAEVLLTEGYYVIGTYNKSEKEAEELLSKYHDNFELIQVDFSNREDTEEFLRELKDDTLYGIVNNAGIIEFEAWNDFTMEAWDRVMEVNLNAAILIIHTLRNNLEEGGSIVNISSTDGMIGAITSIAYSASKAALINLTQSLTNVFAAQKVRVNSIAPGFVGDGMNSPALNDAKWINPLNRTANYNEIANVVKFLLSEEASFINGTNIVVDGGTNAVDYFLKKESELVS